MAARVSLDGGALQYGGVTATLSQVAQLSFDAVSGIRTAEWRLYFRDGFSLPSGWTDLGSGCYGYDGITPPEVTLSPWGKWIVHVTLVGNDGSRTTDKTLGIRVLSTSGIEAVCRHEETQFGSWVDALDRSFVAIEAALSA